MQVCDIPMSGFTNWTEHPNANTLSVNSNGILFLSKSENHENEGDILSKITFGSRTSKAQRQESVIGLSFLESESGLWPLCLTEGGGLFKTKIVTDQDTSRLSLETEKMLCCICRFCSRKFSDITQLNRHLSSQHSGPVFCKSCKTSMEDVTELNHHKESCSFPCGVNGCEMGHKTLVSAIAHRRKFTKSLKTS